jgi:hypothetical protein
MEGLILRICTTIDAYSVICKWCTYGQPKDMVDVPAFDLTRPHVYTVVFISPSERENPLVCARVLSRP